MYVCVYAMFHAYMIFFFSVVQYSALIHVHCSVFYSTVVIYLHLQYMYIHVDVWDVWFEPSQLGCLGSSVGKSICPECRVSWVQMPPEAIHFSFIHLPQVPVFLSFFLSFFLCISNHHVYCSELWDSSMAHSKLIVLFGDYYLLRMCVHVHCTYITCIMSCDVPCTYTYVHVFNYMYILYLYYRF